MDTIEFLKEFGNPLVVLKPESRHKTDKISFNKVEPLDLLIQKNSAWPSALYFTPNGNHGVYNKVWDGAKFSKDRSIAPYYSCLHLNIKDKECYTIAIHLWLEPTYVIKTAKEYVFIWMIVEQDRTNIHNRVKESDMKNIQSYIGKKIWAKWQSLSLSDTIKLPWSFDREFGKPENIEIVKIGDKRMSFEYIKSMMYTIETEKTIEKALSNKWIITYGNKRHKTSCEHWY